MKEIRINAFDMNCVGHIQQGMWTHPRDQSVRYMQLDYWTDYARRLEAGLFDGIFLADEYMALVRALWEGSWEDGAVFAATHAECVFLNGQAQPAVKQKVDSLRSEAEAQGRSRDAIRVFLGAAIAQMLIDWSEQCGVDGYNLLRTVVPECVDDFIACVVPELQSRGAYKTSYAQGTLREKLFGRRTGRV